MREKASRHRKDVEDGLVDSNSRLSTAALCAMAPNPFTHDDGRGKKSSITPHFERVALSDLPKLDKCFIPKDHYQYHFIFAFLRRKAEGCGQRTPSFIKGEIHVRLRIEEAGSSRNKLNLSVETGCGDI
jgi:hypothetical protein